MSANDTTKASKTDWNALETMTDDEIDYSDIPPLDETFFQRARQFTVSDAVQLDTDVLQWFKSQSKAYPALINTILRKYMEVQQQFND